MVTALGFSLAVAPAAQAKAKLKTPSAPTVKQVLNYKPKNGKVDVLIKISLPKNNGGSKILGSLVTAGGKSCKMTNLKTFSKKSPNIYLLGLFVSFRTNLPQHYLYNLWIV
jgi:hypothetical protein